ncbi:MAG: DUF2809 domain-containing protein [Bacteroidota bacterium]
MNKVRDRKLYFIFGIVVVIIGLASRKVPSHLPLILSKYPGDVLWAIMVFFVVGFLFTTITTKKAAIISLLFSFLIETSQLYHAPWIDTIRHTILGALILGSGFSWYDMCCYVVGVSMGFLFEKYLIKIHPTS